jgi:hypothetical protein
MNSISKHYFLGTRWDIAIRAASIADLSLNDIPYRREF